jgi:hypothetical protein
MEYNRWVCGKYGCRYTTRAIPADAPLSEVEAAFAGHVCEGDRAIEQIVRDAPERVARFRARYARVGQARP